MLAILLIQSGYSLEFDDNDILNDEVLAMVLEVAEHRMNFGQIVEWIKARLFKL